VRQENLFQPKATKCIQKNPKKDKIKVDGFV
jgi:hypothetical protein